MIRAIALAIVVLACGVATAEDIALPKTKVVLHLADGWHPIAADKLAPGLVAGATTDAGMSLAVTRARVPNADAWRTKTRDAYLDGIERGIAASIPKYKRVSKKYGEVNTVPYLDLVATRAGGTTVTIRVLVFRTYALSLSIESAKALDDKSRAIVTTFAPPPPA